MSLSALRIYLTLKPQLLYTLFHRFLIQYNFLNKQWLIAKNGTCFVKATFFSCCCRHFLNFHVVFLSGGKMDYPVDESSSDDDSYYGDYDNCYDVDDWDYQAGDAG